MAPAVNDDVDDTATNAVVDVLLDEVVVVGSSGKAALVALVAEVVVGVSVATVVSDIVVDDNVVKQRADDR